MSITDELREYVNQTPVPKSRALMEARDRFNAIADRIDAEHDQMADFCKRLERAATDHEDVTLWGVDYIALPVDADGEYIHVGDDMEYGKTHGCVIALMLSNYPKKWGGGLHWGIQLEGEQAPTALDGFFRHHRPDTWERIIEDATALGAQMGRSTTQVDDLVARCKALAGEE